MNESAREALKWVGKILNGISVPYRIGGGAATYLYGSGRPINDIDISISGKYFEQLLPLVEGYIIAGPKYYQNEKWDCVTLSLNYKGQDIDLTDADTLLMKKKDGSGWIKNKEIYNKYPERVVDFEGVPLRLMDPRVLLEYKRELEGDHQEFDIQFLERYLRAKGAL